MRTARTLVNDALVARDVDARVVEIANIVVGELVMNAVRHGEPDQDGTLEVSRRLEDQALRLSVRDAGRVDRLAAAMPGPASMGGGGLTMVERLCRWSYDTSDGTRVTAELALG